MLDRGGREDFRANRLAEGLLGDMIESWEEEVQEGLDGGVGEVKVLDHKRKRAK